MMPKCCVLASYLEINYTVYIIIIIMITTESIGRKSLGGEIVIIGKEIPFPLITRKFPLEGAFSPIFSEMRLFFRDGYTMQPMIVSLHKLACFLPSQHKTIPN
jgi:hypothetical protein